VLDHVLSRGLCGPVPALLRPGGERRGEETASQAAEEGPSLYHSIT
jgi:hypothetical protein